MPFSDFRTIGAVQQQFQIRYFETLLHTTPLEPAAAFCAELQFSLDNIDVFTSEAARSESVIFPILREAYKPFAAQFALWIQKPIQADAVLYGTPDYLIATKSKLGKTVLETPLVLVAEAKKNDFEQGWGQCLAELIAAQKINGNPEKAVYGIVTDGKLWEFGQLEKDVFTKFVQGYTVDDLSELFGVLEFVLRQALSQSS
jgi:hypothetical protein